ncbi:MAG TPA: hypothetical protein VKM56_08895 [Verrucomicrobiae bacterium]|nr:hypothetical protein [Verrucomicrobiae bacterium]
MSRIRGKNTNPEMRVRSLLNRMGFRFRLHVRIPIPAPAINSLSALGRGSGVRCSGSTRRKGRGEVGRSPVRGPRAVSADILLPKYKTAIFVHGCFWHRHSGCKNCTTPTNRREWWLDETQRQRRTG